MRQDFIKVGIYQSWALLTLIKFYKISTNFLAFAFWGR